MVRPREPSKHTMLALAGAVDALAVPSAADAARATVVIVPKQVNALLLAGARSLACREQTAGVFPGSVHSGRQAPEARQQGHAVQQLISSVCMHSHALKHTAGFRCKAVACRRCGQGRGGAHHPPRAKQVHAPPRHPLPSQHSLPHWPQFFLSVSKFTHFPSHFSWPAISAGWVGVRMRWGAGGAGGWGGWWFGGRGGRGAPALAQQRFAAAQAAPVRTARERPATHQRGRGPCGRHRRSGQPGQ